MSVILDKMPVVSFSKDNPLSDFIKFPVIYIGYFSDFYQVMRACRQSLSSLDEGFSPIRED